MSTIDFQKVDKAFQRLATDPNAQTQLAGLNTALTNLKSALPGLNDHEAHYVASSLLNQRVGVQSNVQPGGANSTTVHGFVIKSAVD
jgi:hypothetical protein